MLILSPEGNLYNRE